MGACPRGVWTPKQSSPIRDKILRVIRRVVLLALLVYVALDLSLPGMPGAFVLDPEHSVESVGAGRSRPTVKTIDLPAPATNAFVLLQQPLRDPNYRLRPNSDVVHPARPVPTRLPRSACVSPRRSEDPH